MQLNLVPSIWKQILGLATVGVIFIISIVPFVFNESIVKEATLVAQNTAQQYLLLRGYYTKHVISKLKASDRISASSNHKYNQNTIPLPATMIHELSELSKVDGLQIKLYSAFPFPQRASRELDTFQQQAWKQLNLKPNDPYITIQTKGDQRLVRFAIADRLTEQGCVDCHNSHPQTPRTGWKIGDVRGVLEVIVDIDHQLKSQESGSYQFSLFFIIIFLIIFYCLLSVLSKESKNRTDALLTPLNNQKIAMNAHSLVSMADKQGNIVYVNDKFLTISGYSETELIGKKHSLLNSNNQPKSYWHEMHKTVLSGAIWHDEVRNKAKDGRYYWVDTTIVPNFDKDKKVVGFTSIRTDITQQKENIANLAIAKEQAEVASESKADFLANMSHEIRTPMNGVIGMTNLLLGSKLNLEQNKLTNTLKSSAIGLLSIINDILDFSKIDAGKLDLELIPFDLGQLLEDIGASLSFQSQLKNLELICPANPVTQQWVKADPGRLRQVLTNLIGNAIKFTEQGEVAVYVRVLAQSKGHKVFRFEVIDTGIGINDLQQQQLFEQFSQADNSTTRKFGGTGLGLSISKKLVELMDGEIGIDSRIGQGATFWFTLPLLEADSMGDLHNVNPDLINEKVLIVEGNDTNRELLHQHHKVWEIPHTLVDSAKLALGELKLAAQENKPYTIAIIDLHIPDTDVVGLFQQIHKTPKLAQTKIILTTGRAQVGDSPEMKAAEFQYHITKPIQQSELLNALLTTSGLQDATSELAARIGLKEQVQFNAHILAVEDNSTNQLVIKGLLANLGITIDLACNGEEAITALQGSTHYDLVLMDCQMPLLDGYQATKKIRSEQTGITNIAIPIIAMTANAMTGDKKKCLDAGMDDYLSKPVEPNKVIFMLRKWMPDKEIIENISTSVENDTVETENNTINKIVVFDYEDMAKRMMNDPVLMKSVTEMFCLDLVEQLDELKASIKDNDAIQATAIMHQIKGASANVGGKALSALALEMELAGKAGNLVEIQERFDQLEHTFKALAIEMEQAL